MFCANSKLTMTAVTMLIVWSSVLGPQATAQAEDRFGAIAFSQISGEHGFSSDYRTRIGAETRAIQDCRKFGGGCRIATWFKNGCGALAVGARKGWGAEWGHNRTEAETLAMRRCSSLTSDCKITRMVCTER